MFFSSLLKGLSFMESPFNQPIDAIRNQILDFLEHASQSPPSGDGMTAAVQNISNLLEELQAAEGELRAQNDEVLQAQLAVEKQRRRYTDLLEFAPDGYLVTDAQGVIQEANLAAANLLQAGRESLLGKPFMLFIAPEDHPNFFAWLAEIPASSGVQERALRLQPRGKRVPFDASLRVTAFRDDPGQAARLQWMLRDITRDTARQRELRHRADQNQRQAALLRSIFDADAGGLAVLVGPELRFAYTNLAYVRSLPDPSAQIAGRPYREVWSGNQMSLQAEPLQKVMQTGQPYMVEDLVYPVADRLSRSCSLRALLIEWGDRPAVLLILWDLTDLKQGKAALMKSQQRQSDLLESIQDGFMQLDEGWRFTYVNARAAQYLRIRAQDLVGKNIWQAVPQILGTEAEQKYRQVMESRRPDSLEAEGINPGRIYEIRVYPSEEGISIFWLDITERKQAEQALRESQERFRSVLENSLDIAYRHDLRRDCYDYISPVVEQVLGYSANEMNGMPPKVLTQRIHPDDRAGMEAQLEQARADGSGHLVYRFRTKTGEYRWLADNVTITRDERGTPVYRTGILRDITETKATEARLNLTVERLQAVIASPLIGVMISDADGKLYQANDYYLDLIGYTRAEFDRGLVRWDAVTPPEFLPLDRQALGELHEQGVCRPYEKQYLRKDGSRVWVLINDAVLPGEEELIVGFVLNIDERKRVEKQSRDHEVQIEMQRRLLSEREEERLGIARDLHDGPLQDLIAAQFVVQGMQDEEDPQRLKEQAAELRQMLSGLLRELRNFAMDLRPPVLTAFGLERGIRSHLELFENRHPEIRIHFSAHQVGQLTPSNVRIALFRIYQESLNNIVKHANATDIWITFTKDEDTAIMEIRDNGEGFEIPHDWLDLARRGHLGLVGMRERALAVGGDVEIASQPGKGTVLRVIAPINA